MSISNSRRLYLLFFVSGFCSLVYQMIWTRLAFAFFGIITPVLSVVLSVFMLGLAVGAWAGGRTIPWLVHKTGLSAIFFYGGAELIIGLGAFATPGLFAVGQQCLLAAGQMDSFRYLLLSALVLAVSILPWCVCMGATFPWMMAYVREEETHDVNSFSFLYYANVLGAMTGTILTAFVFVETMGFRRTLTLAAAGNFAIAAVTAGMGWKARGKTRTRAPATLVPEVSPSGPTGGGRMRWILFTTGFSAMAMEVVWTRAFTPVLKTQVYSLALIVFMYLGATFLGSVLYRRHLRKDARRPLGELVALLGLTAFLPIIAVDTWILPAQWFLSNDTFLPDSRGVAFVLGSICPMCGILGYLTPSLIDQYAAGHPAAAGKAYGINVIGCILGPLCASYFLLPHVSERYALVILGLPLLSLAFLVRQSLPPWQRMAAAAAAGVALVWSLFLAHDFEGLLKECRVHTTIRRDYAASVISYGEGSGRQLLVNGVGMTALKPDPKIMVHLPMALHTGRPESALIICFGMGTSYRAALRWDVRTTAVELVPSVVDAFAFYHADAASVLANPKGTIIIDDGRRFLKRTREKYDVIVVDPPPPPEAAGSSLLYSREFFELAKEHLKPNGILQSGFPAGPGPWFKRWFVPWLNRFPMCAALAGSIGGARIFWVHATDQAATAGQLASRLPPGARQDLMEWMDGLSFPTVRSCFQPILSNEAPIDLILNPDLKIQITDDQPFNEYYLLRQWHFYSP